MQRDKLNRIARWGVRGTAGLSIVVLLLFIFGSVQADEWPTLSDAFGLACFPGAVIAGLCLAFRRETIGAIVSLVGLTAFYFWHATTSGDVPGGPWFAIFTVPALLFLLLQRLAPTLPATPAQ